MRLTDLWPPRWFGRWRCHGNIQRCQRVDRPMDNTTPTWITRWASGVRPWRKVAGTPQPHQPRRYWAWSAPSGRQDRGRAHDHVGRRRRALVRRRTDLPPASDRL